MWNDIKKRLRSAVVWVAALSQVLLIVGLFIPSISNEVKIVGTAIIEIATIFGVLNNPADKENF